MITAQLRGDTNITAVCDCSAEGITARGINLVIELRQKFASLRHLCASPMRSFRGQALPHIPARLNAPARPARNHVSRFHRRPSMNEIIGFLIVTSVLLVALLSYAQLWGHSP
jgi:hypothetical protein